MPPADHWALAVWTTIRLAVASAAIATAIGVPSAWAAARVMTSTRPQRRRLGRWWVRSMTLAVALPLILHAAAWEATAGKFGWLMQTMTGGNLLWVAWAHGVHGAALVGLGTLWGTTRIDPLAIQHARLDFSPADRWWRVRLPIALPWVGLSAVGVMTIAASEMSVADLHSVRTVADQFYLFYALDPDGTALWVTTVVPVSLAVPLTWLWYVASRGPRVRSAAGAAATPSAPDAGQTVIAPRSKRSFFDFLPILGLAASFLLVLGVPLVGLLLKAGHTVVVIGGGREIRWSLASCIDSIAAAPRLFADEYSWTLQLSLLTAGLVLLPAAGLARCGRVRPCVAGWIDVTMMTLVLIPGPIIGVAIARVFTADLPGFDRLATQTLVPTILAASVRAGVVAYAIFRRGFEQLDAPLWHAARLDGGNRWRVARVELPLLLPTALLAFLAAAIVASGDVAAVLPVIPPGVSTVGTRLFGLLHSGARYQEASLAFWYLAGILAPLLFLRRATA